MRLLSTLLLPTKFVLLLFLFLQIAGISASAYGQPQTPAAIIQRALNAAGITTVSEKVLHFHAHDAVLQPMQSDRMYPPYYSLMRANEIWFAASTNVQRTSTQFTFFGSGPGQANTTLVSPHAAYAVRDTLFRPLNAPVDRLNAWAVLLDWASTTSLRRMPREVYRDYEREVLARESAQGEERLYLDPKSGLPVKLDYAERHFLWGQIHVEYVYSTWIQVENVFLPSGAFRVVDGETEIYRTVGQSELLDIAQAPRLALPTNTLYQKPVTPPMGMLPSPPVDTIRVSANTFLLKNSFYTETVTLLDGTIYLLDATLGEERAQQDAAWMEKLFPGAHPMVVVVTDLAWPHIAGVRYWVARGATIVSHRMSESFLRRVIAHKWTLAPDMLEQNRKKKFNFMRVDNALQLAHGKLQLFAIDGGNSEGALMAFLPQEKFLWAGDYIQTNTEPSAYATEVWQATKRVGILPERTAAQHLPLTPWPTIEALQRK